MLNRKLTEKKVELIQKAIPLWYKQNGRIFPWRVSDDPYEVLIAEILLQKTTAQQVVGVYERFFNTFSNPEEAATADTTEIEKIVGQLGLVKRAHYIKSLSRQIVDNNFGQVPEDKQELGALLGVGRYTRNAVLCFSFNVRVPIVDTNVARVLRRYFRLPDSKAPYLDTELWKKAEEILPAVKVKEYNLGLLDLADSVCLQKSPLCDECPLKSKCSEVDYSE